MTAYRSVLDAKGRVVGDRVPLSFSWLNDGLIRLATAAPAGNRVTVERETYADTPLVDFQDAAIITEEDLDLSATQSLHVAQEARDRNSYDILEASRNVMLAVDEIEDLAGRAENAAVGAESSRRQCEGYTASTLKARDETLAAKKDAVEVFDKARTEAAGYAQQAKTEADRAVQAGVETRKLADESEEAIKLLVDRSEANAKTLIAKASVASETADLKAKQAATEATKAQNSAASAHADMQSATQYASQAKDSRDRAETAKTAAGTSKTQAEAARDAARASEVKAKEWADNPPNLPVEEGRYSARHYADLAAATGDCASHVAAEDPHPQYMRKDQFGSDFFAIDEFGDITIRKDIVAGTENLLFHMDAWDDVALKA